MSAYPSRDLHSLVFLSLFIVYIFMTKLSSYNKIESAVCQEANLRTSLMIKVVWKVSLISSYLD